MKNTKDTRFRYPIAAGTFYESDEIRLIKQIEGCFLSEFGPGKLPKKSYVSNISSEKKGKNEKIVKTISAIIPHAGYSCSGMCAAHAYLELSKHKIDTIIILGTDHTGKGSGLSIKDWKTPLGIVKVDKEFCKLLIENKESKDSNNLKYSNLIINENSHLEEHSIEVQLPFLQYIYEHINDHEFKIVPITISNDINYRKIANSLYDTIKSFEKDTKKRFAIIVSGDFTHYGHNYGYVPFANLENYSGKGVSVKENLNKLDKTAIDFILKLNDIGFVEYLNKTKATICGKYGFVVLIELNKLLRLKGKLLKYYSSGDILGDYSSAAVGYASIFFE